MPTWYTVDGYHQRAIAHNIFSLAGSGYDGPDAIATAHRMARECFRRQHRTQALPPWIYQSDDFVPGLKTKRHSLKRNPAPRANPIDAFDAAGAAKLSRKFSGKEPTTSAKTRKPRIPDALACIGQVSVIQYIAERDGEVSEYRHAFRAKSRPHLCIGPDGKTVLMLGGAFTFTEDGFTDE